MAVKEYGKILNPRVITTLQLLDRIPIEVQFAMKTAIVVGQYPTATEAERAAAVVLMLVESQLFGAKDSQIELDHERTQGAVGEIVMLGFLTPEQAAAILS